MKATIKDVAKLAGVSFKTVSRVINEEPNVGQLMQDKVWAAIRELDYQPNLSARLLRGTASSIGFIYDNPNSHYVIELQNGILKECHKRGFELIIHPCDSKSESIVTEVLTMVKRSQVAGLVLTPPLSEMPDVVDALQAESVKIVRVISASQGDDVSSCVFIDDHKAAFDITQYLLELGHEKIAFLGGDKDHRSSLERLAGYRDALKDHKLELNERLIIDGEYSFESGVERSKRLLQRKNKPTAIFACNDEIAAGTLFAARLMGIKVPEELSIVGFEDSPFSRQTWPKLTTAQQANSVIAANAAALLISEIREDKAPAKAPSTPRQIQAKGFYPKLVIRDSSSSAAD